MTPLDPFLARTHIAYFSMEIALEASIPTYSGGLGVLAGDMARSCADLELPVVFVTLASREGYLRQEIDSSGLQVDHPDPWDPATRALPLDAAVAVRIEGRAVWIRAWLYRHACPHGGCVPVILLDTQLAVNAPEDRDITNRLYGGDEILRLKQEAVLGMGGERLLRALGFEIRTYHLNEGHAALLALSLLSQRPLLPQHPADHRPRYDVDAVRESCIFTTHTPVEASIDRFSYDLVARVLGDIIEPDQLRLLAGEDALNMTRLALNLSAWVNGVAARHAETARRMFPGYRVRAVTNGVHVPTWAHPAFQRLFQTVAPDWAQDPTSLLRVDRLPDSAVWEAHVEAKSRLVHETWSRCAVALNPDVPILAFARRMTSYKRPDLLFSDLDRLRTIADRYRFQIVVAGKAHPRDTEGRALIQAIHRYAEALGDAVPVAFLPGYDMALAQVMVAGADIWLNTPIPPMEASGTSGMKAALNGVPNLSVLDGWWAEGCEEDLTGWAIGRDGSFPSEHAADLYEKLSGRILPLWYNDQASWIRMMKLCIARIGTRFNSQHMMSRYATSAYLR